MTACKHKWELYTPDGLSFLRDTKTGKQVRRNICLKCGELQRLERRVRRAKEATR